MLPIFALFFLLTIVLSSLTTIPLSVGILVVSTVLFKKSWVFFAGFLLGLFLDLFLLRILGYTSLVFTIFVFLIWLYERKFETQSITFVFSATFLGSIIYLMVFGYNNILIQSFINAVIGVLLFKFSISNFKFKMNS